jgi:hypothetical protein
VASSISDRERRTDIAERAREGLEEDLEDMRSALRADLREYERLVRSNVQSPPEWTGLTAEQLRAPFEFRREHFEEPAWIGPRLVAILAGRVERFVADWLPADREAGDAGFDTDEVEAIEQEAAELAGRFERLQPKLKEAGEDGHVILDELWETTLARLDRDREDDIDALEDLVGEGALDTGPDARQERANLWEEQREKADRLRERWEALHDLIDDGVDYAVRGLQDLRAMVRRACEGLEGAYPAVTRREVVERVFESPSDVAVESGAERTGEPDDVGGEEPAEVESEGGVSGASDAAMESGAGGDAVDGEDEPADQQTAAAGSDSSDESARESAPDDSTDDEPEVHVGLREEVVSSEEPAGGADTVTDEGTGDGEDGPPESEGDEDENPASSDTVDQWLRTDAPSDQTGASDETADSPEVEESQADDSEEASPAEIDSAPEASEDAGQGAPTEPMITSAGQVRAGDEDSSEEMLAPEGATRHDGPKESEEPSDTDFALESSEESTGEGGEEPESETGGSSSKASSAEASVSESTVGSTEPPGTASGAESAEVSEVDSGAVGGGDLPPDPTGGMDPVEVPEVEADEPPAVDEPEPAAEADRPEDGDLPDPLEVGCIRVRTEWTTVPWKSVLAALGPPVGFLVGLVAVCLLHLAGVGGVANPVAAWSWTEPSVAVAFVWCICAPMLLQWYPRWAGWKFQFVHEAEVRDDATLEMEEDGFHLDRIAFKWEAIQHFRIRRWEAPDDEMIGWLLVVEPNYHDAIELIAPEHDRRRWEEAEGAILEPPTDAWQIEAEALDRMTGFLERTQSELP